jgi:hypothetical protein
MIPILVDACGRLARQATSIIDRNFHAKLIPISRLTIQRDENLAPASLNARYARMLTKFFMDDQSWNQHRRFVIQLVS